MSERLTSIPKKIVGAAAAWKPEFIEMSQVVPGRSSEVPRLWRRQAAFAL
jgi:hypothetical protein